MAPTIRITAVSVAGGGFRIKLSCSDSDAFYDAIDLLKQVVPVGKRAYDPDRKSWMIYDRGYLMDWCGELEGWADVLHDFPAASQGPATGNATLFSKLYITPDAPIDVIKASYKALAKLHHPDLVGDGGHDQMVAINDAYTQIMETYNG